MIEWNLDAGEFFPLGSYANVSKKPDGSTHRYCDKQIRLADLPMTSAAPRKASRRASDAGVKRSTKMV